MFATLIQNAETSGQSLRPEDWCEQIGCTLVSYTSGLDIHKTLDATACQKHKTNVGKRRSTVGDEVCQESE